MMFLEISYWLLIVILFYSFVGYGLLVILLARLTRGATREQSKTHLLTPEASASSHRNSVTMLIAAHNEADCIVEKLDNVLACLCDHDLSIVVVSDGSTDLTVEKVSTYPDSRVRLVAFDKHQGKIAAMNAALVDVNTDIVVFSDANSMLAPDSLRHLLCHFADAAVGGVCGKPAVQKGRKSGRKGLMGQAEHLYWCYDSALKQAEDRLAGAVSAQGTLYAVRRSLVKPIPLDVADDLMISLNVVAAGFRLVFEPSAVAFEPVSDKTAGEYGRRVRSTERGWRGLMQMRRLFNPLHYGFYALELVSHKVLRRLSAFILPLLFIVNGFLAPYGAFYMVTFSAQALFYLVALCYLSFPVARGVPGFSLVFFFVMGHVAMAHGVIRVFLGQHSTKWQPVR